MIVLDTNVLSELIRARPEPRVIAWVDAQPADALAITSITVAELLYGVERLPGGARKRNLADAIGAFVRDDFAGRVLPFDAAAATAYAAVVCERERRGAPIASADAQIAAICRQRSTALATRNGRDFAGTGVELIDPWAQQT